MEENKKNMHSKKYLEEVIVSLRDFILEIEDSEFDKDGLLAKLTFFLNSISNKQTSHLVSKHLVPIFIRYKSLKDKFPNKKLDPEVRTNLMEALIGNANFALLEFRNGEYSERVVNSEEFYRNKIVELEKEQEINRQKNYSNNIELENKLNEYKNKLEEKQKELDAKESWEKKINNTFPRLKKILQPIEDEHERLKSLYNMFIKASAIIVFVLIIAEITAIVKLICYNGLPDFKGFVTLFTPVPLAGLLLWGAIYQMNRAQRQLVILAKNIHSIEYVQGLLLSINDLSPSIEDGINRINSALDKMIDNHLNLKDENCELDLLAEERKDSNPADTVVNILKELKGIKGIDLNK